MKNRHDDRNVEIALKSLDFEFPSILSAFRHSLQRISVDDNRLSRILDANIKRPDATEVRDALRRIHRLKETFCKATLAAHSLESFVSRTQATQKIEKPSKHGPSKLFSRVPYPIDLDRIKIIVKVSDVEREMQNKKLTFKELLAMYKKQDLETGKCLFSAHRQQKLALKEILKFFRKEQVLTSEQLIAAPDSLKHASAVIALGGDDHLRLVSHFIKNDVPILGINSDPQHSFGWLLGFWYTELKSLVKSLESANYRFEPWTRLQATVDGQTLSPAIDLFLGETFRKRMSRHILSKKDVANKELFLGRQKGSGLLVTTGAGSTGWFNSEAWPLYPKGTRFPSDANYCRFFNTGISKSNGGASRGRSNDLKLPKNWEGLVHPGEQLVIRSLNRGNGIVTTDSFEEYSFMRGATAIVTVAPNPLWVIQKENPRK